MVFQFQYNVFSESRIWLFSFVLDFDARRCVAFYENKRSALCSFSTLDFVVNLYGSKRLILPV